MKKTSLAFAFAAIAPAVAMAAPTTEEMWQTIQQQQREIERLKAQAQETDAKVEATASAVERGSIGTGTSKTTIGGYGEHHFNRFEDGTDMVDAHRFVLFVGHEFSDDLKFFSELEVEHGFIEDESCDVDDANNDGIVQTSEIECESSPGEVELEQAFVQWSFAKNHSLTLGQFLLPIGIMNETHEPDTFYGTERNNVEAQIIPATWWETGAMVSGELAPGLSYNLALHSGLNMSDGGTVRGGRQKSAKATAEDLAVTARLKYTGIPGLELAAAMQQQQDATQGSGVGSNEATLVEMHVRYTIAGLTLTALAAEWDIDGANFEALGTDQQEGAYVEASYKITPKLGVFVRQSEWDNAAGSSANSDIEQTDFGVNYWLHERVVLKADYTDSDIADKDALNLGLGWSF